MKGFINILKPLNMTSSDVVVKVRGILRKASGEKQKVGHLGTLDPLAVGVLPIAVGNATRLFDYMLQKQKTYVSTFKFSITTDTLDRDGNVTCTDNKIIGKDDILKAIPKLTGHIMQIPPQYSAKSVNGKKAYDIAREGGIADLKPKQVNISAIELLGCAGETIKLPCDVYNADRKLILKSFDYILNDNEFAFKITCGSGTYIRAIARDLATLMNTVGYMSSLCRTESGCFSLENAVTLQDFESEPLKYLLPMETALGNCYTLDLNEDDGKKVLNGVRIDCNRQDVDTIVVMIGGLMVGLGEIKNHHLILKTRL